MADAFVSALWGNDGNDGLTVATAKASLQAGSDVSGNGDTVFVYPGIYSEIVSVAAGSRRFEGIGKVILDGQDSLGTAIQGLSGGGLGVENIEIKNYTVIGVHYRHNQTSNLFAIKNNIIHNCGTGIFFENKNGQVGIGKNNTIYNCSIGIQISTQDLTTGSTISNNTIYDCTNAFNLLGITSPTKAVFSFRNNAIKNCAVVYKFNIVEASYDGNIYATNNNIYDLEVGQVISRDSVSTDQTALSGWQSVSNQDSRAQEGSLQFANVTNGLFSVLPGSIAESGSFNGDYVGAKKTEIGWYTTSLLQTDATLSNTQLINEGIFTGINLDGSTTQGTVELNPLDAGQSGVDVTEIFDIFLETFPNSIIDLDPSDNSSPSGEIQIEFKSAESLATLSGASYINYNLRQVIGSGTFLGRFIQARLTLNA